VILPRGNEAEAKEMKPELLEGLQILYVDRCEQVFDIVFGKLGAEAAKPAPPKPVAKPAARKQKVVRVPASRAGKPAARAIPAGSRRARR
jgi:hypothetical protein